MTSRYRRQLVGALVSAKARAAAGKSPRRSTEASPQDTFRQRQRAAGIGAKGELIRELENWPFDYPFDGVYPELAAALN